ncbi:MAG: 3'-5' exonuclease, partial [Nitrososphaera sp.]|nr:3'-5' exonuclease [Nitrososphaera sp.]
EGKNPLAAVSLFHDFIRQHWTAEEKVNLVGHCIDFDVGFIKRLFKQAGVPEEYPKLFTHRTLDTSGIGRYLVLCGRLELEPKSDALFEYFGINLGESARHTALGDALATAMLLTRLVEFSKLKVETLTQ